MRSMNRTEFLKTLSSDEVEQLKKDIELEGCAWVARKHKVEYRKIIMIKNDLKLKVNKFKMNARKSQSMTDHFDREREKKA